MSDRWSDNFDTLHGVDPTDYEYEDDFLSARMSARGDFDQNGGKKEGCYIATCVYGSYDCPEVMTFRRFRDSVLKRSVPGRAFIRCYYALSPKFVALLGGKQWLKDACRKPLDALIGRFSKDDERKHV